mgnify:CR=1 FL=1
MVEKGKDIDITINDDKLNFTDFFFREVKEYKSPELSVIDFSKTTPLYREYIYLYLKQEVLKLSKEGHGSVMAHLTKNGVENLDVISPPKTVIEEFHNIIIPFIEHKKLLNLSVAICSHLVISYFTI